jgi:3-dehydroquinate dehydratase
MQFASQSNLRGETWHHSWLSPSANGIIGGFGVRGYALAIAGLKLLAEKSRKP